VLLKARSRWWWLRVCRQVFGKPVNFKTALGAAKREGNVRALNDDLMLVAEVLLTRLGHIEIQSILWPTWIMACLFIMNEIVLSSDRIKSWSKKAPPPVNRWFYVNNGGGSSQSSKSLLTSFAAGTGWVFYWSRWAFSFSWKWTRRASWTSGNGIYFTARQDLVEWPN